MTKRGAGENENPHGRRPAALHPEKDGEGKRRVTAEADGDTGCEIR
ncbi:MAG: hypothetical protein LUC35_05890 [Clostridiales bacterium]|nr:hypothetical protein [Clostridiales bacterium]